MVTHDRQLQIVDSINTTNVTFYGLSTDAKPTEGVGNGSCFIEMDTGKGYFFDVENNEWHEQSGGSGGGGARGAMDVGKSRARREETTKVRFDNVAGCVEEKEEMKELVDYLKNPQKFAKMGARVPKGVLLTGAPGTGKTLLAKAIAGEAGVPFFSISGSDFVCKSYRIRKFV